MLDDGTEELKDSLSWGTTRPIYCTCTYLNCSLINIQIDSFSCRHVFHQFTHSPPSTTISPPPPAMPLFLVPPLPISPLHHDSSHAVDPSPAGDEESATGGATAAVPCLGGKPVVTSVVDPFDLVGSDVDSSGEDGERRLEWLRSQIVGGASEFKSPFGCRRITYCDHMASGRFLQVIEDYIQDHVLPFYGNTHTGDSYVGLHTTRLVNDACRYVKRCMGAGPCDVLLFCGSGCTASIKRLQEVMGITVPPILRSLVLASLPPSDRWVVFVGPYEHHSNLLSWRQSLADVVEVALDTTGHIDIPALEAALKSPEFAARPKLGSFSACSNVTGIRSDTRAIARVMHQHGGYACFDFACSGPYVNVEMRSGEADGYDAVFLSPHKFLGGPGSPGILLMTEELYRLKGAPPSTSGGGTVLFVNGYNVKDTLYCEDLEEREDAGTPAIVQKIRAALAFRVKEHLGHELIRGREESLARRALDRLVQISNVHVLGNTTEDRQPIVSFLIYSPEQQQEKRKHLHCRFVTMLLNDLFGVQARGGCACAGPYAHALLGISHDRSRAIRAAIERGYEGVKPGFTRVSFGYYAPPEETEFVLDAIGFVARYGHRFLSLYSFDWRTGDWHFSNSDEKIKSMMMRREDVPRRDRGLGEIYEECMRVAARVAEALPARSAERQRQVPDCIDPELISFMT